MFKLKKDLRLYYICILMDTKFKTFTDNDNDKISKIDFNKKLLKMNLTKIVFSNPKNTLRSLFADNKTILMMNDYIEELLGHNSIHYYKLGTNRTMRCLYDDKPQDQTKLKNRKFIQESIKFYLLERNNFGLDDYEEDLINEYLQLK